MAKLEKIFVVLLGISLLMRFLRWDGAAFIGFIACFLLSILYFPMGFATLSGIRGRKLFSAAAYREQSALVLVLAAAVGMFLATAVVAGQFAIMGWTGAAVLRLVALVNLLLMFVMVLALRKKLPDGGRAWLTRGVVAVVATVLISFLPALPPLPPAQP